METFFTPIKNMRYFFEQKNSAFQHYFRIEFIHFVQKNFFRDKLEVMYVMYNFLTHRMGDTSQLVHKIRHQYK